MFPRKTMTKTGPFHKYCSITVPRRNYATFCTAKLLLYGTSCCDDDTQTDKTCESQFFSYIR